MGIIQSSQPAAAIILPRLTIMPMAATAYLSRSMCVVMFVLMLFHFVIWEPTDGLLTPGWESPVLGDCLNTTADVTKRQESHLVFHVADILLALGYAILGLLINWVFDLSAYELGESWMRSFREKAVFTVVMILTCFLIAIVPYLLYEWLVGIDQILFGTVLCILVPIAFYVLMVVVLNRIGSDDAMAKRTEGRAMSKNMWAAVVMSIATGVGHATLTIANWASLFDWNIIFITSLVLGGVYLLICLAYLVMKRTDSDRFTFASRQTGPKHSRL